MLDKRETFSSNTASPEEKGAIQSCLVYQAWSYQVEYFPASFSVDLILTLLLFVLILSFLAIVSRQLVTVFCFFVSTKPHN